MGREKKPHQETITARYFDKADGRTKTVSVAHEGASVTNPYTQPEKDTAEQQAKLKHTRSATAKNDVNRTVSTGACDIDGGISCDYVRIWGREDRSWLVESLVFRSRNPG